MMLTGVGSVAAAAPALKLKLSPRRDVTAGRRLLAIRRWYVGRSPTTARLCEAAMAAPDVRHELVSLLPRLRRFALVLTRSADSADELVQSALVRALGRLDQFSDETHLDRWLFQITKTVWLNTQRSAALRRAEPLEQHHDLLAVDGVRDVEAKISLSEVRSAFERLSSDQRQVILLVCVEGYSYSAAAEVLGVPVGTVMSRLSRGRAALMELVSAPDAGNVRSFSAKTVANDA